MRTIRTKNVQLVTALARANISQRELADRCGLHPTTVSTAINCRVDVKPATAELIATILGEDPAALFPEYDGEESR